MFAIAVELLSGRYVACAYNDRDRAEWPPHPARLFSALVATWSEGEPETDGGQEEREALSWLEQQAAPEILATPVCTMGPRAVVTVFVPVNDLSVVTVPSREKLDDAFAALASAAEPKERARAEKTVRKLEQRLGEEMVKAIAVPSKIAKGDVAIAEMLLADRRTRQPRTFPCVTPECATFAFAWPEADPPQAVRRALERLLARIVRLGHSTSFVRAAAAREDELIALSERTTRYSRDDTDGRLSIRWVGPGQLDELIRAFDSHCETEPRVLPARFVPYCEGGPSHSARQAPAGVFADDFIVFARVGGPRLPITSVVGVARQLRRALMSCATEPIHETLSGHTVGGGASEAPHLAIVPLPVVLGPHADGAMLGIALVLPSHIDKEARLSVMRAIGQLEQRGYRNDSNDVPVIALRLGDAGELELQRVAWGEDRRATLRSNTWCRESARWASATPVALDRNPGDLHDQDPHKRAAAFREATASVIEAVKRIGLPPPIEIDVVRSCVLPGTAKPRAYPRFPIDTGRPQRVLVHVRLVFAQPVCGPLLIGAGRYHGLGLCLPVDDAGGDRP